MHLAGYGEVLSNISNLRDAKVAILGSSPISLVAANIWNLLGAQVTLYEKNENIGGAWAKFKQVDKSYPISTHIIMPNELSSAILELCGANAKSWDRAPMEFDVDT